MVHLCTKAKYMNAVINIDIYQGIYGTKVKYMNAIINTDIYQGI